MVVKVEKLSKSQEVKWVFDNVFGQRKGVSVLIGDGACQNSDQVSIKEILRDREGFQDFLNAIEEAVINTAPEGE